MKRECDKHVTPLRYLAATDTSGSVASQEKIMHVHESPFYHYAQFPHPSGHNLQRKKIKLDTFWTYGIYLQKSDLYSATGCSNITLWTFHSLGSAAWAVPLESSLERSAAFHKFSHVPVKMKIIYNIMCTACFSHHWNTCISACYKQLLCRKSTTFLDVMLCDLVEVYEHFGRNVLEPSSRSKS